MIPSDPTCWDCYLSVGCTPCPCVCSWACFPKPRDPYSQFEEGRVATETVDRFLTQ
jgi:hypothetical protein